MEAQRYIVLGTIAHLATWESRIYVDESAAVIVDNEAQLDEALAARDVLGNGREIYLRGEGTGGVIDCTSAKIITGRRTRIRGPGQLRFSLEPGSAANPRAITVLADDVELSGFELTSSVPVASSTAYAIALAEALQNVGHRMKLADLRVWNWKRCLSKDGALPTPAIEDILVERCYLHTFGEVGANLNFGLTRLHMRDTRILGRINAENHTTHNAVYGGSNCRDCVFDNCHFGNVSRIGFEFTKADYPYYHERTRLHGCRSENTGSMGFSTMFGTGIVLEKCVAKNVKWVGFELGGRPPEFAPPNYFYGQGILDGCEVDTVDSQGLAIDEGSGQACGISLDGARDSCVRGATRVSNITSTLLADGAAGIAVFSGERCSVVGATLDNAGHFYIYLTRGTTPNTRGFHEVIGNTCRNASASGATHRAIFVDNTSVAARQNVAWQKAGTTFGFNANTLTPAKVNVDGTPVAYGNGNGLVAGGVEFTGTNLIIPA